MWGGIAPQHETTARRLDSVSLESYVGLVEELDLRKRVNVLYPNAQSLFDGLQIGFVNVGSGNLTFTRRDIVNQGNGPLAFSRNYDSRIQENADFGPGWRLSLSEQLYVGDGALTYVDGAGVQHRFAQTADGYTADPVTPQHARTLITITEDGAVLHEGNDTIRTFTEHAANEFLVTGFVAHDGREYALLYRDGLLEAVQDSSGLVFRIGRESSGSGRITSVSDRHERLVTYRYTDGHLTEVRDLAGNAWSYEYGPSGRLTKAIGANGKPFLYVSYDGDGRVVGSRSGRDYTFHYAPGRTTVMKGTGPVHLFEQNSLGITAVFSSTTGMAWRLTLDALQRVESLDLSEWTDRYLNGNDVGPGPGGARLDDDAQRPMEQSVRRYGFSYSADGELAAIVESTPNGEDRREFIYDAESRLTGTTSSDGRSAAVHYSGRAVNVSTSDKSIEFNLTANGRVSHAKADDLQVAADYDTAGNLVALHQGTRSVRFTRDPLGRIIDTMHANGQVNRYFYDDLGNRTLVEYGQGGAVSYTHDAAGNITHVEVTELDGTIRRQTVEIGDMNQVQKLFYNNAGTIDISYDRMGQPVRFDATEDVVLAEYTPLGSLSRLVSQYTGDIWQPDTTQRARASQRIDPRHAVLSRDAIGYAHLDYGAISFDEHTFAPLVGDPVESKVPGLAEARQLLAVGAQLFMLDDRASMLNFEKPSNPAFQPEEYRSTNCCISCTVGTCIETCVPDYSYVAFLNEWIYQGELFCYCTPTLLPDLCTPPLFAPPPSSFPPRVTQVGLVNRGSAWGATEIFYADSYLTCSATCDGRHRLEGDIRITSASYIQVSTSLPSTQDPNGGMCSAASRTPANIARTRAHELTHANALVGVINRHKASIGTEYGSLTMCESALNDLREALGTDFASERSAQLSHVGFAGEPHYVSICLAPGGSTEEVRCGTRGVICSNNTY